MDWPLAKLLSLCGSLLSSAGFAQTFDDLKQAPGCVGSPPAELLASLKPRGCKVGNSDFLLITFIRDPFKVPCYHLHVRTKQEIEGNNSWSAVCGINSDRPSPPAAAASHVRPVRNVESNSRGRGERVQGPVEHMLDATISEARRNMIYYEWSTECDANWDETCNKHRKWDDFTVENGYEYCGHSASEEFRNKPLKSEWHVSAFRWNGFSTMVYSSGSFFPLDRWGSKVRVGGIVRAIPIGYDADIVARVCKEGIQSYRVPSHGTGGRRLVGMRCEYGFGSLPPISGRIEEFKKLLPIPLPSTSGGVTGEQKCSYSDGKTENCGICYGNSF